MFARSPAGVWQLVHADSKISSPVWGCAGVQEASHARTVKTVAVAVERGVMGSVRLSGADAVGWKRWLPDTISPRRLWTLHRASGGFWNRPQPGAKAAYGANVRSCFGLVAEAATALPLPGWAGYLD